ncbi:MAG: DNA helicase [Pirellulales bacterium]|nr:DNA helicase [Pirellulales bacterium]
MSDASYRTAADIFGGWREGLLTGTKPILYPIGTGELARIEIGPGLVTLIGGAPGAGKTAFTMQCVVDALRLTPELRALVCNVEMSPALLLDRQLSRLSGIDLATIRQREFVAEHAERLDAAMDELGAIGERLAFVRPPYALDNIALAMEATGAQLLVLDYIQRIAPPGEHGDRRGAVDASMGFLRQFAENHTAVMIVAAVARQKDSKGRSSYAADGLSLASFRESSELEFGADDAFILAPDPKEHGKVLLKHLKARNSEPRDITLTFDRCCQRFETTGGFEPWEPTPPGKLQTALAEAWNATAPAADNMEDEQ